MIEQTYKLNMIPRAEQDFRSYEPPVVHISQYDKVLRTLRFELYDGKNPFTIPENTAAYIYGMKPDGNAFQYQMDITEDGLLQIDVQTQMATVAGCVTCEVILFEGNESGNRIGSANFKMAVEKAAVGDDAQFSESDMPVIQTLLFGGTPGDILVKDEDGVKWNSESLSVGYMRYDQYDPERTGTVNSARQANNAATVDGHTVARNVLANEYTNEQIDESFRSVREEISDLDSVAVKSVNSIQPDQNGNVQLSKADIGLGNVDNTADTDKPVSTAMQTALDGKVDKVTGKGLSTNDYSNADKGKLDALPTNTELIDTLANKADLGSDGKVPAAQLPSFVDDVLEYASASAFPETGETGKIYVALDTNKTYRWGGSAYVEISESLALGETSSTAYPGNKGKATTDALNTHLGDDVRHITNAERASWNNKVDRETGKGLSSNDFTDAEKSKLQGIEAGAQVNTITGVKGDAETDYRTGDVNITKENIGLGNVNNTSDLDKPISTATQAALDLKQNTLTFDTTPTTGSTNPVTSDGIAAEISALNNGLSQKANTSVVADALAQKQNKLTFDTEPTENSQNPVTSGGIFLSQKAQDNKTEALADLLNAKYADDWATIQTMIQIGYGKKYYPVGTQFTIHHDVYGDMLFDVIGHDHDLPVGKDHSMTLLMHNVIYSTQFDEVEGFYYCENGLTAGTYNVTITRQPWFAGDAGKTFQFTLADDVPAGAILWWDGYNVTREGRTVRVYNTRGATSAAQTATMTEGNGGTALGSVDGTGNFNIFDRSVLSSNDWEESGVRQWLNADVASNWWEPKTNWDRLVNYYSRPGFLYGFDADFKNVLVETTHGNRSNTVFDSHGTNVAYSTTEKIFLLCNEEVNLAQEQSIVCGTVYDYYKDAANAGRIKYDITSTSTARVWWLRSPLPSGAGSERSGDASGALNSGSALIGLGVAAACVIA